MNEQIRASELRVIGPDGESLGILTRSEALLKAEELDLDLVEVNDTPPVAKLQDYAKEKFRADREMRKHRRVDPQHEVKEIQLKPTTDVHDMATKARAASGFLAKGNRVRVVVLLRGRLVQRPEMGEAALERFYALLEGSFVAEHHSINGNRISVALRPERGTTATTSL
jgi:translation initiation factor IF-3